MVKRTITNLKKKSFFLSAQRLTPLPPLSGLSTKKNYFFCGFPKAAGLTSTLTSVGPFTLFAPTNAAFEKFPKVLLEALLADRDALAAVLLRHVVPSAALKVLASA